MPPRGGGGRHRHHHHGGYAAPWQWGWGGSWGPPSSELVVIDRPSGPLYDACPCPCKCHDGSRHHTVAVHAGQACCKRPFMPRLQAIKMGVSGFDLGSVPWKPVAVAAGGVALLWWLTRRKKARR